MMSDEKLRALLRDMHDSAMSAVTPPGVEMARRTWRRRRAGRLVLASTAAIVLGFTALTLPGKNLPPPATQPSPSLSVIPSPSLSPSATPIPTTPNPAITATASPSGGANASGVGLAPYFVAYGDGISTAVGPSGTTDVPIGVTTWGSGITTGVKLTVDLSQITNRVDIVAVSSPCSQSGSTVTCDFGTLHINGQKNVNATLSLRAKAGATPGRAGTVYLRLTANPAPTTLSISGSVNVSSSAADLVMTSTVPSAQIGQTVTITYTVKNQGPTAEPWATLDAAGVQPGTQYVGGEGCTTTATTFDCRIDNLAVGQSRVVTVMVRVTGCAPAGDTTGPGASWSAALDDPNTFNNDVQVVVRVLGC